MGVTELLLEDIPKDNPHHNRVAEIFASTKRASDLVITDMAMPIMRSLHN